MRQRGQRPQVSPWARFDEQRRHSARKYRELDNALGIAFRPVQQEAFHSWDADLKEDKSSG